MAIPVREMTPRGVALGLGRGEPGEKKARWSDARVPAAPAAIEWQATFDAISDPVIIIDKDHTLLRANRRAILLMGERGRDWVDRPGSPHLEKNAVRCYELLAGRLKPCEACPFEKEPSSAAGGLVSFGMSPEQEKEGTLSSYRATAYPLEKRLGNGGGDGQQFVIHYRDVGYEVTLYQQLVHAEKLAAMGILAGGVAHEINNPLGGILAFTQLMMRDLPPDSPLQKDLHEIEGAALRCKEIVGDLLEFTRRPKIDEPCEADVNNVIGKLLPLVNIRIVDVPVTIETQFSERLAPVKAHPNKLQQVFLNLVTNGIAAMKAGGVLEIKTAYSPSRDEVVVAVTDQGVGISEENLKQIFHPFFTTKTDGTGLGLPISRQIVESYGGRIEIESAIGRGTSVSVTLPVLRRPKSEEGGES